MAKPQYYTEADLRQIVQRELAAARPSLSNRVTWYLFVFLVAGAAVLMTADHFKLISPALVDKVLPPPQTTFSTPPAAPGASVRRNTLPPFPSQPGTAPQALPAPVLQGELPGATVTATPEVAAPEPYTTQPNLGPSSPDANPGFSCGVEPGNDPNATCEETRPQAADPEQEPNIYSVTDRTFVPAVLPASSVDSNSGFDAGVEPGSEPTPVR